MKDTTNFKYSELACPCCHQNITTDKFMDTLQAIRDHFGKPMKINSGYRCRQHNLAVGGVANSVHLDGNAADISITDGADRFKFIQVCIAMGIKRIGLHKSFIHIDIADNRPSPQIWFY